MQALFDKELTEMEREVRDLKTIHQRGLGTVRFYEAETTATINGTTRFNANLVAGEPLNPLAISVVYGTAPLEDFNLNTQSIGLRRYVTTYASKSVKVKFISSSAISGITQS